MADERTTAGPAEELPPDGPAAGSAPADQRAPGWREVLLVAVAIVAVSLGAAFVTGLLPAGAQDVVFKTPLVIVVLIVGTVGLLLRLAVRRPSS